MTEPTAPAFAYQRAGLRFEVWPSRIDVEARGGFLGMGGKKTTILLKQVTDVQVEGIRKQLTIRTADGTRYSYQLGTDGEKAKTSNRRTPVRGCSAGPYGGMMPRPHSVLPTSPPGGGHRHV